MSAGAPSHRWEQYYYMPPPIETPAALPPLVNLQDGATLLPDPEKPLRTKAAELASSESDRMAAAYVSAGCWTPPSKEEQEE
jgi:hypothetical protein